MRSNTFSQVQRGKDIKLRAYNFSLSILRFLQYLRRDYIGEVVGKQLLRSATSIGANIIEAQASSSKREFKNFMNIALKSANETNYWICLIRDGSLAGEKDLIDRLLQEAIEISKIPGSIQIRLKG